MYLVLSILTYTALLMFRGTIPANKYQSSTYIDLRHPVIAGHALFSFVQLLEGSMMVLHLSGSHFLTSDGF